MKNISTNISWIYKHCTSSLLLIIIIISFSSLNSILNVGTAMITKFIIDSAGNNEYNSVKKWIIIFSLFMIGQILINSSMSIVSTYCREKLKNKIQEKLYEHMIFSTWMSCIQYHSVELLTRITNDVETISELLVLTLPEMFSLFILLISSIIALFSLSPIMALTAFFVFPILILVSEIYGRKLKHFYTNIQKKEAEYNSFIQESFNNILIIKSFCLEVLRINKFKNIQNQRLDLAVKKSYISCISDGLISFSSMIGYFLVFVWGAFTIKKQSIYQDFGSLTAMFQLFGNIQYPIYGLASAYPQFVSAIAAIGRLKELENMELEDTTYYKQYLSLNESQLKNKKKTIDYINGTYINTSVNIKFDNVSFSYIPGVPVIQNVSLKINSGETIGIVGSSGKGKTTLIRLLLSLVSPTCGNIFINNEKLSIIHRNLISYVPQGNTLFSGTILENLKFGNSLVSESKIYEALKLSSADDFVNSLENKLNTIIGENGLGLSQGQSQRLTIARAILRKTPILILDEATSSLDEDTEINILNSIHKLNPKPICIIITHRPAALSICDKIYKLENKTLIKIK